MKKLLLYSQSETVRDLVRVYLRKTYRIVDTDSPHQAIEHLSKKDFSLFILGIHDTTSSPDRQLFQDLETHYPEMPVFLITDGKPDLERLLDEHPFIQTGTCMPTDPISLREAISSALSSSHRSGTTGFREFPPILFYDLKGGLSLDTRLLITRILSCSMPVLLLGDYGTKLELIPRLYHRYFRPGTDPFVVQCHTMKDKKLKGKLHELMRLAESDTPPGTIGFQHIEQLSAETQELLLEWSYAIEPYLHNEKSRWSAGMFFCARPDLLRLVETREFNRELYYRISGMTMHLPSMKDLGPHIASIYQELLDLCAGSLGVPPIKINEQTENFVNIHSWPLGLVEMEWFAHRMLTGGLPRDPSFNDLLVLTSQYYIRQTPQKSSFRSPARAEKTPYSTPWDQSKFDSLLLEIVHNIKNPLVAIKIFAQLLPDKFDDDEFRESFSKTVNEDINRIDSFLTEITYHINLGDPELKNIDMYNLISECIDDLTTSAGTNKITFMFDPAENKSKPLMVVTDYKMMHYAVRSILQQGIADLDPGGHIRISSFTPDSPSQNAKIQIIFELTGARERKDSFDSMNLQVPGDTKSLKLLLAERVLQKLHARLEQQIVSDKSIKIVLNLIPQNRGVTDDIK